MKLNLCVFLSLAICCRALDYPDYKEHPCLRPCTGQPMTCRYNLTLEEYTTMGPNCLDCLNGNWPACLNKECIVADGRVKPIYAYNRMLPAPSINVCLKDRIIVHVENKIKEQMSSVHWHGIHQRESQSMDGVPHVTQCPINPSTVFTYDFIADMPGSHFYHSHSGMQRSDGPFGSLVIREANSPNEDLYDFDLPEHVMIFADWSYDKLEIHRKNYLFLRQGVSNITTAILVNGFGSTSFNRVPSYKFKVDYGYKYRFRAINAGSQMCPITIQIDNHRMKVIAVDGHEIQPVEVDSITIEPGERADFIIEATSRQLASWIKFQSTQMCNYVTGLALLSYQNGDTPLTGMRKSDIENFEENAPINKTLNCMSDYHNPNCIQTTHLISALVATDNIQGEPDMQYYLGYDFHPYVKPEYRGVGDEVIVTLAINNITYKAPQKPLLMHANQEDFCNAERMDGCDANEMLCSCVHIVEIPEGALVELIFVNEGKMFPATHPMHIHGYNMAIIGSDKVGSATSTSQIKYMDANGELQRNFDRPARKDTISVPPGGYTIARFIADNKGYWFLHCHIEMHMDDGMALIFKVGDGIIDLPKHMNQC